MSQIDQLEIEMSQLRGFLRAEEEILEQNPADQAANYFAKAKRNQIQELQSSLRLAKAARACELLEVRLMGIQVENGSLPLSLLARLAAPLNDALTSAAYRIVTGEELAKGAPPHLVSLLNLRLAGIGVGSTRLFISGNTAPDLTGESVLESALREIFRLLAEQTTSFLESVDAIGVRSTRRLSAFMNEISRNDLTLDMSWEASNQMSHRWSGTSEEAKRFSKLVATVSEPAIHPDTVTGEIRKLSDSGKIEVRDSRGTRVRITYPREKFDIIQTLHLGQHVSIKTKRYDYKDNLTRSNTSTHHFDSLRSEDM